MQEGDRGTCQRAHQLRRAQSAALAALPRRPSGGPVSASRIQAASTASASFTAMERGRIARSAERQVRACGLSRPAGDQANSRAMVSGKMVRPSMETE